MPVFALANAGIAIDGAFLGRAFSSPITLGILFGYVVGKPVGIFGCSWLVTRLSGGRLQPPVGWAAVAGGGTISGIGFTVALLVATLAFGGRRLEEAKLGILGAAVAAALVTWLLFRATALLPRRRRIRALIGTAQPLVDLYRDVDPERDHLRGPIEAPVTDPRIRRLRVPLLRTGGTGRPRVAPQLRRRPLCLAAPPADRRPPARTAGRRSLGSRSRPGRLLGDARPPARTPERTRADDLVAYAEQLGLDVERFERDLREHSGAGRVAEDVEGADLSGVSGTPTFFINGRRHPGAYDIASLSAAVRVAGAQATIADD